MKIGAVLKNLAHNRDTFRDAVRVPNRHVLTSLLGPAARGFLRQAARGRPSTEIDSAHAVHFDWTYERDRPALARLHAAGKRAQWDAETALDWSATVDPADPGRDLLPEAYLPFADLPGYAKASPRERTEQKRAYVAWTLSQFLHGERYVIADEGRHVHFGVLALEERYTRDLGESERRDRQDWAFEMALLLRNRFLVHEFYEEYYAHAMGRAAWDAHLQGSAVMQQFRQTMFKRIVPNLKRIGLLPERLRRHYEQLGLLAYEHLPAAPDLTADDLLAE